MFWLTVLLLLIYALGASKKPEWGIYLILFLLPTYQIRFSVFGLPTTFLEWLILILMLVLTGRLLLYRSHLPNLLVYLKKSLWLIIFIGVFLAAAAVSVFVSPVTLKAAGVFKAYFLEGALFWLVLPLVIDSKTKLYRCFWALGGLVIYLALFGIYQYFTLDHLPPAWWGPGIEPRRVVSVFTYPNAVALLIAPILALFSGLWVFRNKLNHPIPSKFLALTLVLGIGLLILTFSRGAWIGLVGAIIFLAIFSKYKKVLLAVLVVGALTLFLIPATRQRLLPVFTGTDPAGQQRFLLYQGAGKIIAEQPVLGAGLMGFRDWYGALRLSSQDEILNYPHNFFLNFWVETGLFGLLAVLAMLTWTLIGMIKIFRSSPQSRGLLLAVMAAWLALLLHGQFDAPFFKNDLAILFWFLLAPVPLLLARPSLV
jgi:hypothetical protein